MKLTIVFLLALIIISCSNKICPSTARVNQDTYARYLRILNESKHPKNSVMPKEIEESITFLEKVSGIKSTIYKDHYEHYSSKSEFNLDIKKWKKWFKENKCKLTLQYVDSAINSNQIK